MRLSILLLTLIVAASAVSLSACNTVQGLGQDIESAGRAGEEAMD